MNLIYLIIFTFILTSCSTRYSTKESSLYLENKKSGIDITYSAGGKLNNKTLASNVLAGAEICKISYPPDPSNEDRSIEIAEFNDFGFDVTYFSPSHRWISNYPELYILSKKHSNAITIVFVGTNSDSDWVEDINSGEYFDNLDNLRNGDFYILPGHAGFRAGVLNLIKNGFFKQVSTHITNYDVRNNSDKIINVTLVGHSQGAALAQLFMTIFDGLVYQERKVVRSKDWNYKLKHAYVYGSPYVVSTNENEDINQWKIISLYGYDEKLYNTIRDDDITSNIYNVIKWEGAPPARHFGTHIRITRDNVAIIEKTSWKNTEPHGITTYIDALKNGLN